MTNTFRKHHKTFMWVIIIGTVFSFVYYLSPTSRNAGGGGGSSEPAGDYGTVNGDPITRLEYQGAIQEAKLVLRMNQGRWPTRGMEDTLRQIAYERLFVAAKLKQMNIDVTPEAAARYTRQLLGVPEGQAFPQDRFAEFVKKELNGAGGVSLEDFDRYVRVQVGQQLLLSMFGLNGQVITPKEAEFFYRRENETMSVELVRFPASNYLAGVTFKPQDVKDFYTNHQDDYRVPDRVQVNYIRFTVSNYMAAANQMLGAISNLDGEIDHTYGAQDPSSYKDDAGKPLSETAAKAKIKEEYLQALARRAAQTNANDLATQLFEGHDKDHPVTQADLQKLAQSNGLAVVTTEPFDEHNPPKDLELPATTMSFLFQLQFGDPDDQFKLFAGTNYYYMVGLQQKFPTEDQPFEKVEAKVTEDYRNNKALEIAKDAGSRFAATSRAALGAGQPFDFVCHEQGMKPEVLTPFAAVTPSIPEIEDKEEFDFVARVAYEVPEGQCSGFAPTPTGGFVVYVKSRSPLDETIVQRDLPAYLDKFRRDRQIAAFNQWLEREMRAHVVPAAKPVPIG